MLGTNCELQKQHKGLSNKTAGYVSEAHIQMRRGLLRAASDRNPRRLTSI